jgi:catechol 2,3-dioxygenase-like lactoylglutathione lyase family enzyme
MRRTIATMVLLGTFLLVGCKGARRSPLAEAARACHDSELSCAVPIFNTHNLERSLRYYRDVLGFKIDWKYGDPPDFASVSRGHGVLFLSEGGQGTPGAWTMMFTPDVDKLYKEIVARKAIIRMPPKNMPWRVREMHVADPDGNVMRFGTGIED